MKDLKTLLLIRQWLSNWSNTVLIPSKYISMSNKKIKEIDNILWKKIINEDSPFGGG